MSALEPPGSLDITQLPTELVEKIASYLDSWSLKAFSSACRDLRSKSYHTYGTRFFTATKIFLYPSSLQILTDIANTPVLAKYVREVSFGTQNLGLIDPIHEEQSKRNMTPHTLSVIPVLNMEQLITLRLRIDSYLMSQAFMKFPQLEQVHVGDKINDIYHQILSYDARTAGEFDCPSGHCHGHYGNVYKKFEDVLHTVATAMEQIVPPRAEIGLGFSLDQYDQHHLMALPRGQPVWYGGADVLKILTYLSLAIDIGDTAVEQFVDTHVDEILEGASIGTLVVQYFKTQSRPATAIHQQLLSLRYLHTVKLDSLWAVASAFAGLVRTYRSTLTHVSFINCSVHAPSHSVNFSPSMADLADHDWLAVIQELQALRCLKFLHLERLRSSPVTGYGSHVRDHCTSDDLALEAIWVTEQEVQIGLEYLTKTHRTYTRSFGNIAIDYHPHKPFLNFRYANFKVSSHYAWTENEIQKHRALNTTPNLLSTPYVFDIVDDQDLFPLPGYHPPKRTSEEEADSLEPADSVRE